MSANVRATSVGGGTWGWIAFVIWNAILASIFGALTAVLILGLNFLAFCAWLAILVFSIGKQRPWFAATAVVVQVAVMMLVLYAAALAPVKTVDRVLDRTITIPHARMSLADLEGEPDGPRPEWRPSYLSISVTEDERAKEIVFPETKITLRQFVAAVEAQSTLRHRFAHCGNGSTILWGGDCSFGLHLRRPRN